MSVYQQPIKKRTKDGRSWYFVHRIKVNGKSKLYMSKSYMTRKEASNAEKEFLIKYHNKEINVTSMTFKQLFDEFYEYKKDKVKITTQRSYRRNVKQLSEFYNLKIKDITLDHYIAWRKRIASLPLKDKTKNGYYKLLKTIFNYGTRWHDFNFASIYNKMEKFNNPNNPPEEMKFYTWEEFKQFLSVIDELKWKTLFEVLYFCGLRRGELRGLSWDNIDFFNKEINIIKNVAQEGDTGEYIITTPKTRTSTRTLPVPEKVMKDLHDLFLQEKKQYGFTMKWFVFGNKEPLKENMLRYYKNTYSDKAGVKRIRIHDFRHSCASVLINNGASIMVVAKYLGHAKIDETLNTYSHLFKNKMDEIVKTMNNLE